MYLFIHYSACLLFGYESLFPGCFTLYLLGERTPANFPYCCGTDFCVRFDYLLILLVPSTGGIQQSIRGTVEHAQLHFALWEIRKKI